MNLLADESVDWPIVARLRQYGHDIEYVAEMSPGDPDEVVLQKANGRRALLLTADKDFGELVFRMGRASAGVVLIRLAGLSPALKAELVAEAIQAHATQMQGSFSVVAPHSVRIRRKT